MKMQSNSGLTLAIDAGNTRVKWGLFNASGNLLENGVCLNADLAITKLPETATIMPAVDAV